MHVTLIILSLFTQIQLAKPVKWQSVESWENERWKPFQRIEYHYRLGTQIDSLSIYEDGKLTKARRYLSPFRPLSLGDIVNRSGDPDSCIYYDFHADARSNYLRRWIYHSPGIYVSRIYSRSSKGPFLWNEDSIAYDENGWIEYVCETQYDSTGAVVLIRIDSVHTDKESRSMHHYRSATGKQGFPTRIQFRYEFYDAGNGAEEILAYSSRSTDSLVLVAKFSAITWATDAKDNYDRGSTQFSFDPGSIFQSGRRVISKATRWLRHPLTQQWINPVNLRSDFNSQGLPVMIEKEREYSELSYFEDGSIKSEFATLKEPGDWMYLTYTRALHNGTMIETEYTSSDEHPNPRPRFRIVNHY